MVRDPDADRVHSHRDCSIILMERYIDDASRGRHAKTKPRRPSEARARYPLASMLMSVDAIALYSRRTT